MHLKLWPMELPDSVTWGWPTNTWNLRFSPIMHFNRHELLGYNVNYSSFWSLNLYLHSFQSLSFIPQAGKLDAMLTVSHPVWCLLRRKKFSSLTFIHRTFYADGVWLHPWLILNWHELKGSPQMRSTMEIGTFHLQRRRSPVPHGGVAGPLIRISLFEPRNWVSLPDIAIQ